jgi:peptide/nickel transport system permease protein
MLKVILRKLTYGIAVALGVLILTFSLFFLLPADPARMMAGQRGDKASEDAIRRELGLDRPVWKRFLAYLNQVSPLSFHSAEKQSLTALEKLSDHAFFNIASLGGYTFVLKWPDLGKSFQSKRSVRSILASAMPATIVLAFTAMLFATITGVLAGVWLSTRPGSFADYFLQFIAVLGMAGPSFFIALLVAWLFGYHWSEYTGLPMTGSLFEIDDLGRGRIFTPVNLILPALTLGIRPLSLVIQLTRNSMLEVMQQDFIRTARAKGLPESRILFAHALPNALNPVITAVSGWFAGLLAGAVFIEYIFGWHGLGKEMVDALENFDFPVVMGAVLMLSMIFVMINLLVDMVYAAIDPRVRLS